MGKLEIKSLCKSFGGNQVLTAVSYQIADGEFAAVMGQSGCGKSTLLYCVSGMDRPTSGEMIFNGQKMLALSEKEMEQLRLKHMGFIFQKANFLKNLSVADNIVFPAFQLGPGPTIRLPCRPCTHMGRLYCGYSPPIHGSLANSRANFWEFP